MLDTIRKFMRSLTILLMTMCVAPGASAQVVLTDADIANAYRTTTYRSRLSCHDPSVVLDDVTYPNSPRFYVFGSHLGRGYTFVSSNYRNWSSFKAGEESSSKTNSLFGDVYGNLVNYADAYGHHAVRTVLNYEGIEETFGDYVDGSDFDAHGWQYKGFSVRGNQWAPDVIYNRSMKKWCMYMSVNGDRWCSSIVCLTSSSPQGPWVYQGPVVFSGFQGLSAHNAYAASNDWKYTDLHIATGVTSLPARYNRGGSWGSYWPNCIDPCVFYDEDGALWMTYGSWSGGIWMLKLNEENGLRDYTYTYRAAGTNENTTSDPYFGKKIAGGWYVSGEGSYVKKIGSYYYLFLSYGGLGSADGYQMRVFRSQYPGGPYVDPYGTSAIYNSYQLNYGPSAKTNRGMLLMGGYKWDLMPSAEISQGHNSAFTDQAGRDFVAYHTRFSDAGEWHEVRIHQLFLNEDGWVMAAPFEFSGQTVTNDDIASVESIAESEVAGDYQFIRHQYNQNHAAKAYKTPENLRLTSDYRIMNAAGQDIGTWQKGVASDFVTLVISGVTYKGVLVRQVMDYSNINSLCICAVSSSSGSLNIGQNNFTYQQQIWLSKADYKAAIKYTKDNLNMPAANGATVKNNLTLPTKGYLGTDVAWSSSDESVMTSNGVVRGSGSVTLTCSIRKDGYEYNRSISLNVAGATGIRNVTGDAAIESQHTNKGADGRWNGKTYDLRGREVGENYKGIVIKNGRKVKSEK